MSKAEERALEKYPAHKSVFDKYEKQRYAFIEKACTYLKKHLIDYWSQSVTDESHFIEDFKNYMEE